MTLRTKYTSSLFVLYASTAVGKTLHPARHTNNGVCGLSSSFSVTNVAFVHEICMSLVLFPLSLGLSFG